jgi:hypothetical protein
MRACRSRRGISVVLGVMNAGGCSGRAIRFVRTICRGAEWFRFPIPRLENERAGNHFVSILACTFVMTSCRLVLRNGAGLAQSRKMTSAMGGSSSCFGVSGRSSCTVG